MDAFALTPISLKITNFDETDGIQKDWLDPS
jgi:hypothetical protein